VSFPATTGDSGIASSSGSGTSINVGGMEEMIERKLGPLKNELNEWIEEKG